MLVQPGKYKRDANLGSGRRSLSFFSPPALSIHYSSRTGVCVYYWREPSSLLALFWRIACRSMHSLPPSLVFGAALIYRAESASTPENILPRRGVVWSDEWRMTESSRGRARQRGTGARVRREIGRGWWDYVFSSRPSVRGFPLRRARPFFLCTRFCSCLKLSTVCLAYADKTPRSAFDRADIVEWKRWERQITRENERRPIGWIWWKKLYSSFDYFELKILIFWKYLPKNWGSSFVPLS